MSTRALTTRNFRTMWSRIPIARQNFRTLRKLPIARKNSRMNESLISSLADPSGGKKLFPLRVLYMRGGTSKGPYILADDLPFEFMPEAISKPVEDMSDKEREFMRKLESLLLQVMGSPDPRQISGLGGATSITSKAAIISRGVPSPLPEASSWVPDFQYTFAQVKIDEPVVQFKANCGNIMSGVAHAAMIRGLLDSSNTQAAEASNTQETQTRVFRIWNTNTRTRAELRVETDTVGRLKLDGDCEIDGVTGSGSPIEVSLLDVLGPKTGRIFPTGKRTDVLHGVRVTCIDSANPVVLIHASDLGDALLENDDGKKKKADQEENSMLESDHNNIGHLDAKSLNNMDLDLMESIRQEASLLMGLGDARGKNLPKVCLLSPPQTPKGTICSRYFVPDKCHAAHAVTGAVAVAVATTFEGTVADSIAVRQESLVDALRSVTVEHPSGVIDLQLQLSFDGPATGRTTGKPVNGRVVSASTLRTASPIMDGNVLVEI